MFDVLDIPTTEQEEIIIVVVVATISITAQRTFHIWTFDSFTSW
jgi:hypothetical protein